MNICHICGRDIVSPVDPVCECADELKRYREALKDIADQTEHPHAKCPSALRSEIEYLESSVVELEAERNHLHRSVAGLTSAFLLVRNAMGLPDESPDGGLDCLARLQELTRTLEDTP